MMDQKLQADVQAWVDGELDPRESSLIAERVGRDPELGALCENLRALKRMLQEHKPSRTVPETREFYWSKIQRELKSADHPVERPAEHRVAIAPWIRWLIPIGAFSLAVLWMFRTPPPQQSNESSSITAALDSAATGAMIGHEVETPTAGLTALTFNSEQDSVTVIWLGQVDVL